MVRSEERLQPLQERGGQPRWPRKRIRKGLAKALKLSPEGKFDKVSVGGSGTHARALGVAGDLETGQDERLLDGMEVLVTTRPSAESTTDQVCGLFKEHHYVERSNHILKGHLSVSPVYLKKSLRIDGCLCILWLALLVSLRIERTDRNNIKESNQKRRTTKDILETVERYTGWLVKVSARSYRRPSALTTDQQEIYAAWRLNPP
jgi:transposase